MNINMLDSINLKAETALSNSAPIHVASDLPGMHQLLAVMAALAVVVGLILLLSWVSKKLITNKANVQAEYQIISVHHLSPREKIYVIKLYGCYYVLAANQHHIHLLKELSELPEQVQTETSSFSKKLEMVLKRGISS
jgi:flagellar biogenesis protein FliO